MNPHDWHKRPQDCKRGPCTICGCPGPGTQRNSTYHRAIAESENCLARFVARLASKNGYRQKFLYELTPEQKAAIRPPEEPGATGPEPFLWHTRPAGTSGNCPRCGCPSPGTCGHQFHRAIRREEGIPFHFVIRAATKNHTYTPVCPIVPDCVSAMGSPIVPAAEPTGPGDTTLTLMARAAMLRTTGKLFPEIEHTMQLKRRTIAVWRMQWPEHWEAACRSAEVQLVKMVKAQLGTAGLLDDVDGYLRPCGMRRADRRRGIVPPP